MSFAKFSPVLAVLGVLVGISSGFATGCVAGATSIDAELTASNTALTQAVVGSYHSDLGHIVLNADGTYEGGYSEEGDDDHAETLIDRADSRGTFVIVAGEPTPHVGLPLTHATIELRDQLGTVSTNDLSVLATGDLHVVHGNITQIWTKQVLGH